MTPLEKMRVYVAGLSNLKLLEARDALKTDAKFIAKIGDDVPACRAIVEKEIRKRKNRYGFVDPVEDCQNY